MQVSANNYNLSMSDKEEPNFEQLAQELNLSVMDQDAISMYELYQSLMKAGFKEKAALYLVAMIVAESQDEVSGMPFIEIQDDSDDDEDKV